ncbi:hypothetical protein G6F64_015164 [Rhizopus arrhizus]|uniref:Uncharacterized protein n=1 Tax=Rhizopus oryzae TaxID=64495 RepID=A0A9P6WSK8_RHIOR|nr:hypothetical protein G6F64_015164 [Rhizopus arrhizus]
MSKPNLLTSSVPNHLHLRHRTSKFATGQRVTESTPRETFGRLESRAKPGLSNLMSIPPQGLVDANGSTPLAVVVFTNIGEFLQAEQQKEDLTSEL